VTYVPQAIKNIFVFKFYQKFTSVLFFCINRLHIPYIAGSVPSEFGGKKRPLAENSDGPSNAWNQQSRTAVLLSNGWKNTTKISQGLEFREKMGSAFSNHWKKRPVGISRRAF
jgi:hypothetical protein